MTVEGLSEYHPSLLIEQFHIKAWAEYAAGATDVLRGRKFNKIGRWIDGVLPENLSVVAYDIGASKGEVGIVTHGIPVI